MLTLPAVAMACPAWEHVALRGINLTGAVLRDGAEYSVIAGGDQTLPHCGFRHRGHVVSRPDFEFHLAGMAQSRRLYMRATGACDTILLVNGASGYWYFDDNAAGFDPVLEFSDQITETFYVWVGTHDRATCAATLVLQAE